MIRTSSLLAAAFAGAGLLLAACAAPNAISRVTPEPFARASLREAPVTLLAPRIRVLEFRRAVDDAYGSPDSLAATLARALRDSLGGGSPPVAARLAAADVPDSVELADAPDALEAARAAGSRHVLRLRRLVVTHALRELPVIATPGQGEGYARSGGGTSESCVVTFEVEIWDVQGVPARRHAFVVTESSEILLWAYRSALKNAVNRAVRAAAAHLRG